ncbi:MAG TPA: pirin family protein [Clostridia bacterium]|nr:pirin family protein [Clostridia bacterium]
MIRRIASQRRHLDASRGSEDFLLFSYGDYFEPGNVRWGGLRFFNDDLIHPAGGFPLHFHDEIEVVTIVVAGEIRQRQGALPPVRLRAGDVQVLTSGTGVHHTEINECPGQAHVYQLGIFPRVKGVAPGHAEAAFGVAPASNEIVAVASGQNKEGAIPMNADATVFVGSLDAYQMIDYHMAADRCALLYLSRGTLTVNGVDYESGDQARIADEPQFMAGAIDHSDFILVDVPTLGQMVRE